MNKAINSILVLGLGKVGCLVGLMLHETGFKVTGADLNPGVQFPFSVQPLDVTSTFELAKKFQKYDAIVSCLPYHLNLNVADIAAKTETHYFDLTEDVATTKAIRIMSESAPIAMAPQCGLAPGFIGIVGASLTKTFEKIRAIKLRVGALPRHPTGLLGYAFNWSPEGVVNEYLNDCEVIENGEQKWVSPLEWLEKLVINGIQLEAFTTSGGLGTMCETYAGLVENLDYKSIRYPGHATQMNFYLHELLMREDRENAGKILVNAKPPVSEDLVYIHASVEGWIDGRLLRQEFVRDYSPVVIAGKERRAIAWTTAASVCAVIEMVADRDLPQKGFIKQEEIPLDTFLATKNGRLYSGEPHGGKSG